MTSVMFLKRLVEMTNNIISFLCKICSYIQKHNGPVQEAYQFSHTPQMLSELYESAPNLIYHQKEDTYLFHVYQPMQYIYILLEGICCVEKYNHGGQLFTDSNRSALQIFGLLEAVTDCNYHTVSMKCVTPCVYAKIPVKAYMQAIRSDTELLMMSMQYLCIFFKEHVQTTDQLMLDTPRQGILSRLYQYCAGRTFPVTVQIKKEELAQDLNINLRTLYRHLDKLYKEDIISSHKGKICISVEQYLRIEAELSSTGT